MKSLTKLIASLISVLSLSFHSTYCAAQKNNIKPLHLFLQKNADSTLIFKYESNWMIDPDYWIISKKKDTITRYIYKLNKQFAKIPKSIRDTLSKIHRTPDRRVEFKELYSVDVNKYFNALYTDDKLVKVFWQELQHLTPWTLNDDSVEGESCPPNKNGEVNQIYDGGGISLFLITTQGIKQLYFYAPAFYDKMCPGKKGRKTILKIEKLFQQNFKQP